MVVNDNARCLKQRVALEIIASKLAPTYVSQKTPDLRLMPIS
jgi:hypothetical protein